MSNRMRDKIQIIENNLAKLEELKGLSLADFKGDFRNIEAAKHLLQTAVEAMIDIANHLVAREKLGKPETSADTFRILAENGYIDDKNKEKYIVMTKFRNRVVHMYTEVDEEEIYKIINNNLADYREFIKEICQVI